MSKMAVSFLPLFMEDLIIIPVMKIPPKYRNIKVTNLYVDGGDNGWHFLGLPEIPFRVHLENITVKNINNTNLFSKCSGVDGYCDSSVNPECPPCLNNGMKIGSVGGGGEGIKKI